MQHLNLKTPNAADENFVKLAALFPNAVTETVNESGEVVRAIDKDVLMQEINCHVVEGKEERYQFTWPDKKKSVLLANAPSTNTLRPCKEESVNFDTTQNLYIEGDNLEVLKLLKETYLHKIKMIYIDPPYNTGNDFVYEDDFTADSEKYKSVSGDYDAQGNRLVKNLDSNGRFHTDWLNMIYPRLRLAKDLLTDDGVIFISIDDNEVENLRKVCDEVFGMNNFISELIWQNKKGGGNDSLYVAVEHEYVLVYSKNKNQLEAFYQKYDDEYLKRYKEEDEDSKFFWDTFKRKSGKQYYPITCPDGTVLEYDEDGNPISWLRSKETFEKDFKNGEIRIVKLSKGWSVQFKQRIPKGKKPRSLFVTHEIIDDKGTTSTGAEDVYNYFKKDVFSNPKPVDLISYFMEFGLTEEDIVLDFFSGSGTTAESVFRQNKSFGGNRKFICVQVQENIDKMLSSSSANAKRIAENAIEVLDQLHKPHLLTELAKERIRRAGAKILEEQKAKSDSEGLFKDESKTSELDIGFRVLKLDSSNMQDVYYTPQETEQKDLFGRIDNKKADRTDMDLLFQTMLDLGISLSSKIECKKIDGKDVYFVEDTFLADCFDRAVNEKVVTAIAETHHVYVVLRDMDSDAMITNFEQILKVHGVNTDNARII